MSNQTLNAAAIKSASEQLKQMNLTPEEMKRLDEAFKQDEFKKMFTDYIEEISDPKNRKEYEAYLEEMERKASVPQDVNLVRPEPGFAIKTHNQVDNAKIFLNICASKEADRPSSTPSVSSKGSQWSLPNMIGQPRYEKDRAGNNTLTLDVTFHPEVLEKCLFSDAFRRMVCEVTVQQAEIALNKFMPGQKQNKKAYNLGPTYRVLKGRACIGDRPAMLNIRKQGHQTNATLSSTSQINQQSNRGLEVKTLPSQSSSVSEIHGDKSKGSTEKPQDTTIPTIEFVYRGQIDLADHTTGGVPMEMDIADSKAKLVQMGASTCPNEIVARVHLPTCTNARGIELDVSQRTISLEKHGAFELIEKRLAYPVEADHAKAKFDKTKRILNVTMPVDRKQAFEEALMRIRKEFTNEPKTNQEENKSSNTTDTVDETSTSSPHVASSTVHHTRNSSVATATAKTSNTTGVEYSSNVDTTEEAATSTSPHQVSDDTMDDITTTVPSLLDSELEQRLQAAAKQAREAAQARQKNTDVTGKEEKPTTELDAKTRTEHTSPMPTTQNKSHADSAHEKKLEGTSASVSSTSQTTEQEYIKHHEAIQSAFSAPIVWRQTQTTISVLFQVPMIDESTFVAVVTDTPERPGQQTLYCYGSSKANPTNLYTNLSAAKHPHELALSTIQASKTSSTFAAKVCLADRVNPLKIHTSVVDLNVVIVLYKETDESHPQAWWPTLGDYENLRVASQTSDLSLISCTSSSDDISHTTDEATTVVSQSTAAVSSSTTQSADKPMSTQTSTNKKTPTQKSDASSSSDHSNTSTSDNANTLNANSVNVTSDYSRFSAAGSGMVLELD